MTNRWSSAALRAIQCVVSGVFPSVLATSAFAADSGYLPDTSLDLVSFFRRANGLYVDVDVGAAQYPNTIDVGAPDIVLKSVDSRTVDTAWGLAFGWRFTPYFATEVGDVNLGRESATLSDGSAANHAAGNVTLAIQGPTIAFTGSIPFDAWESYLKVGYLFSDADLSFSGSIGPGPLGYDFSKESPAPFAALGVLYKFDDRWYARLELERYQNVAYDSSNTTNTVNVNAGTVGIGLRF
jgi:hypothetical protein